MLNIREIIEIGGRPDSPTRALAQRVCGPDKERSVYLFGRNEVSAGLAEVVDVDGFIDDYAPAGAEWLGKPVLGLDSVPRDAILVNCVLCNRPHSAQSRALAAGFSGVLAYSDLCHAAPDLIPLPHFAAETRADVLLNEDRWAWVRQLLADEESRAVFDDVLRYRLTADHKALSNYSFRPNDQYFEDFMPLDHAVFVDAGGFTGDTTEQFCQRHPDYRKVFLFEPAQENMALAKARLAPFRHIHFVEKGLSDAAGLLSFRFDGSATRVNDDEGIQIAVTTLDSAVPELVSFIKMDLEGWEIPALTGSKRHISADHPGLAVAVYHRPSDFWTIPSLILEIRSDYRVFLRHYTEGWAETVMYFVPQQTA